jgi:hypothetical protein
MAGTSARVSVDEGASAWPRGHRIDLLGVRAALLCLLGVALWV